MAGLEGERRRRQDGQGTGHLAMADGLICLVCGCGLRNSGRPLVQLIH
jgi:hypothetical protein